MNTNTGFNEAAARDSRRNRDRVVQILLTAEREARDFVNDARSDKMDKLKQAKIEAEKELDGYRAIMDFDFQRKVAKGSGDLDANRKLLEEKTQAKISALKAEADLNSRVVINMLVKDVSYVSAKM